MKPEWLDAFSLDDAGGPAAPLGREEAQALASKVVARALPSAGAASYLRHPRTAFLAAGLAGALALVGSVQALRSQEAPCVGATCAESAGASAPPLRVAPPGDGRTTTSAPPRADAPALEAVPIASLPDATANRAAPARRPPSAVETRTASDLLAEANRARRDRDWTRAAALYERVMQSQADESYAATVALASLRLEHLGDARGALVLYEQALAQRPGGALAAQAEAGAARCRRVLAADERARP